LNVFMLNECPVQSAQDQCDEHIWKMYIESAQMLSTAHRLLDGNLKTIPSTDKKGNIVLKKNGEPRVKKYWELDEPRESTLYKAVHMGHPSTVWTTESVENYRWHYRHFVALLDEYIFRRGKVTKTDTQLREILSDVPDNCPRIPATPLKLAMQDHPECMFPEDPVLSYRMFYTTKRKRFSMNWTKRERPSWWEEYKV